MTDDLNDTSSCGEDDGSDGSEGVDSDESSSVLFERRRGGEIRSASSEL